MKHAKSQQIGLERIYRLFELAQKEMRKNTQRSKRYISLALEISKKSRAKIPDELKTKYCKKCKSFLEDSFNAQITTKANITTIKCTCGFERKIGKKRSEN